MKRLTQKEIIDTITAMERSYRAVAANLSRKKNALKAKKKSKVTV